MSCKKRKLDPNQHLLKITRDGSLEMSSKEDPMQQDDCSDEGHESATARSDHAAKRGDVGSWREFAESRWKTKYAWLEVQGDGIYCVYCRHTTLGGRNKHGKFADKPISLLGMKHQYVMETMQLYTANGKLENVLVNL